MQQVRDDLLALWFGDNPDDSAVAAEKKELWWGHSAETDEMLRERFGTACTSGAVGILDHWTGSPRGRLALILLLDQIPRAIYRGQPEAFAYDADARRVASQGLASGADRLLRPIERVFFYLPFEHSEELLDQERSLALFRELVDSVPESDRETFSFFFDYAVRHHAIIARFGRFPHRNAVLGRQSTPEETRFLEQPGSSF
jgi:uncharacterized protein (DUF924 family)